MKKTLMIIFLLLINYFCWADINDFELNKLSQRLRQQSDQIRLEAYKKAEQNNWLTTYITDDGAFAELQALDQIGMPLYFITHNENAAKTISSNEVYSGGSAGLTLSGSGIIVREWDGGGVLLTHQEFGGRVTQVDSPTSTNYHATHVAGTIMASGYVTSAKGMAFAATLRAFDWTNDTSEMASEAAIGALVSNHSYGYGRGWSYNSSNGNWYWYGNATVSATEDYLFGFYDSDSQTHDQIAYNAPDYLIVKSAGNDRNDSHTGGHYYWNGSWTYSTASRNPDGNYDCIGTVGVAKNILTVGAVDDIVNGYSQVSDVAMSSFSSWGPADDGRIKPDICANGVGLYSTYNTNNTSYASLNGTSMSSPSVTGSLALLQEYYNSINSTNMLAASLKGLVIHTADEAGSNNGPDYQFGWGLMNTESSSEIIKYNGTTTAIIETSISNGGNYSLNVNSDGSTPLVATICWTDPAGTPTSASLNPTTKMLVNDLDLRITRSGATYYPWKLDAANPSNAATNSGDNNTDNIEKVEVTSPASVQYTINVTHKGTLSSPQNYSLIISGIDSEITTTYPNGGETLYNGTQYNVTWSDHFGGNNVKLEVYRTGSLYHTISSNTTNDGSFNWTPTSGTIAPGTNYKVRVTSVTNSSIYDESNANFSVFNPPDISISQATFSKTLLPGQLESEILTIGNTGGATLNYSGSESISWLSFGGGSTFSNSILYGGPNQGLSLDFDATGVTTGTYNSSFNITSNDPDESPYLISVTLIVPDNSGSGSGGNTGTPSVPADVDVEEVNIDGIIVDPDITVVDQGGATALSASVTVSDAVQGGTAVPNPESVEISYDISLTGSTSSLTIDLDLCYEGLIGLSEIYWLNGSVWQMPDNIQWENPAGHVTFSITFPSSRGSRDGSTEIILGNDNPLPVTLSSLQATFINNYAVLHWITQSETQNAGWNVYRAESSNSGQRLKINANLIPGAGTTSEPTEYSFTDQEYVISEHTYWYWLESFAASGDADEYGPIALTIPYNENNIPQIPDVTILETNYPNPFNPTTSISFNVMTGEEAELSIYNMKGQKLLKERFQTGSYNFNWNASDYGTGIYYYKLSSDSYECIKKMLMIK
jgi:subtilisin family serine protease